MTKDEFYASGWALNTTTLVVINLKDNAKSIFPARLKTPVLWEVAPKKIYQHPELKFPDRYTAGTPLSLIYEIWIDKIVESPTLTKPAQWVQGSVPLESVDSIVRMPVQVT